MSIATRLTIGFGALVALVVGASAVSFLGARSAAGSVDSLAEIAIDSSSGAGMTKAMLMVRMNVKDYLLLNTQEELDEYEQWMSQLEALIAECDERFQDPERREALSEIVERIAVYRSTFDRVTEVISERNDILSNGLDALGPKIAAELKQLVYEVIDSGDTALASMVARANNDMFETRLYILKYYRTAIDAHRERAMAELADTQAALEAALAQRPEDPAPIEAALEDVRTYGSYVVRLKDLIAERNELVLGTLDVAGPEIASLAGDILASLDASMEREAAVATDHAAAVQTTSLTSGVIGAVLGVCAATLLLGTTVRPLNRLVARFREFSTGEMDLTSRLDAGRRDELGALARYLNAFLDIVHDQLRETSDAARSVGERARRAQGMMAEADGLIEDQAQRLGHVAAATEEFSSSIAQVTEETSRVSQETEASGTAARTGEQVVSRTIESIESITNAVRAASDMTNSLGDKSNDIAQIVGVINDIADQTNLLALNAAIEAARAGDHGRGFAVVADEVRKLAERTTQATQEVARSVEQIRTETVSVVEHMKTGQTLVDEGSARAREAGDALTDIVQRSSTLLSSVSTIATTTTEQKGATDEITRSLAEINDSSAQTASASRGASEELTLLSEQSDRLLERIARFKL
ncbi:MAG: methyl-accepting chemotaxis protein [Planctomycetota bacterium]